MNAKALAERKVARQLRHRAKTGGRKPNGRVADKAHAGRVTS